MIYTILMLIFCCCFFAGMWKTRHRIRNTIQQLKLSIRVGMRQPNNDNDWKLMLIQFALLVSNVFYLKFVVDACKLKSTKQFFRCAVHVFVCLLPILVFGVTSISFGNVCASCNFDQHLRHLSCRTAIYSVALTVHKIYCIGLILIVALHMKCGGREREYQHKSAHKMLLVYFGKAGRWNVCHHYEHYEIKFEWLRHRNKQIQFKRCKFSILMHSVPFG